MGILNKLIIIACMLFMAAQSYAAPKTIEFSADAVISVPQQPVKQTKLFVSKNAVRSETTTNGQNIVEIVYPDEGKAILINDPLKSYKQRTFSAEKSNDNKNNPCNQIRNSVCEKLGTETIDGIKTEKWQIISNNRGRQLRTLHWIDIERKLALREFFPDGTVAELKMIKKEKINGRNAEKWQRTLSRPDGSTSKSYQWYDAALKISIKEELPGGYIRELKNIKLAKQPADLFKAPDDYRKIDMQPAMQPRNMNR